MNAEKKVPSGASVKPEDVIFILSPEKIPPDRNVRFAVWIPEHIAMKATTEDYGVFSETINGFPEPKLTAHGPIKGSDGSYYYLIDLVGAKGYDEVRRATLSFCSILKQVFGIQPSLCPYTNEASLRAFEIKAGLGNTPFPTQKEPGSLSTIQ